MNRLTLILAAVFLAGPASAQLLDKFSKAVDAVKENAGDATKMLKGAAGFTLEEEQNIGDSVALEIISAYGGVWRDEEATRRVNLIGGGLARYSGRPDLEWRFALLDSETVNAFSAPGGFVFISRGLYSQLTDDDALAAVLAHEVAHIDGKHALNSLKRGEFFSGATSFLARRSSDVQKAQQTLQQFDLGVGQITKLILEKGLDPKAEYAADLDGRSLAVTTGYRPGALRGVLAKLMQQQATQNKIFDTHPPLASRIERLDGKETTAAEPKKEKGKWGSKLKGMLPKKGG